MLTTATLPPHLPLQPLSQNVQRSSQAASKAPARVVMPAGEVGPTAAAAGDEPAAGASLREGREGAGTEGRAGAGSAAERRSEDGGMVRRSATETSEGSSRGREESGARDGREKENDGGEKQADGYKDQLQRKNDRIWRLEGEIETLEFRAEAEKARREELEEKLKTSEQRLSVSASPSRDSTVEKLIVHEVRSGGASFIESALRTIITVAGLGVVYFVVIVMVHVLELDVGTPSLPYGAL